MACNELLKKEALETYFTGKTFEQTAMLFKVHRNTIYRWCKSYRQHGWDALTSHAGCWKKLSKTIVEKVVALKEAFPALTIRCARHMLGSQGILISLKGIWQAWQRYGLGGFAKEQLSKSYSEYLSRIMPPPLIEEIKKLIAMEKYREAAAIINGLPVFPQNEIILKIPERLLSLRRRVDRLQFEFAKIPLKDYIEKAKKLHRSLEKKRLFYSSLWVGVAECYAYMWAGEPRRVLRLVSLLQRRTRGMHDPRWRFILTLLEGQACGSLLQMGKMMDCAKKMKTIIRSAKDPYFFMGGLGGLYSLVGFFRESIKWTRRALQGAASSYQPQLYVNLAGFYTTSGDYRLALASLRKGRLEDWGFHSRASMIKACAYLDQGNFGRAMAEAGQTLAQAKKEGVRRLLHPATLIQACCHQAADEQNEAMRIIREVVPLLKKYDLMLEYHQRRMIIGSTRISKRLLDIPSLRLIYMLKKSRQNRSFRDYRDALSYARTHKLRGLFMRVVPFFPEAVAQLLGKGKQTGLPWTFLHMPVFQVDLPVYYIQMLGKLHVAKRRKPIPRFNLRPKDTAFLIHLASNKSRFTDLESLYKNFWRGSKEPARSLSHLLVRIRRILGIPAHLIRMKSGYLRWDVFFTTDMELFYELLSRAAVYAQVGEWEFARREYTRAFNLCRGVPFKGMYDNWSEDARHDFLDRLGSAVTGFAECCRQCQDMDIYRKVCEGLRRRGLL